MLRKTILAVVASLIFSATASASTIMGYAPISTQQGHGTIQLHYARESAFMDALANASIETGKNTIKPVRWHYFEDTENDMVSCLLEY